MSIKNIICVISLGLLLAACQEEPVPPEPMERTEPAGSSVVEVSPTPEPPRPPIVEDFQGEPQLSLFPRIGDFRPEVDDERFPYWNTFLDHVSRVAGLVENPETDNRAWSFRSIDTVDSIAFFSPIAVTPETTYEISFRLKAELPEGASAGVGILEFDEFLWIGEQYSETLYKEHYRGVHTGQRLTGAIDMEQHDFTFKTGPDTRMIHLVLFREGPHSRNTVLFDDIAISPIAKN